MTLLLPHSVFSSPAVLTEWLSLYGSHLYLIDSSIFPYFTHIGPVPTSICLTEEGDGVKGEQFCQKQKSAHKTSFLVDG